MLRLFRTATILVILLLASSQPAWAVPVQPSNFYGIVTRDGANVPIGTPVTAWVQGVTGPVGSTTIFSYDGQSVYNLNVAVDDSDTPAKDGCTSGETITFQVDGQAVPQTGVCVSGSSVARNLTAPATAQPALLGISPHGADPGTSLAVTISGQHTNFAQGMTEVSLGPDITVNSVTVASPTQVTANLTLAAQSATGSRTVTVTTGAEVVTLVNGFSVRGAAIDVYLPVLARGSINAEVTITLTVPVSLSGLGIIAYEFTLHYDPAVLTPVDVHTPDSLSAGWSVAHNPGTMGQWRVAAFNAMPLSGSGTLLGFRFTVHGALQSASSLTLSNMSFNGGQPEAVAHAGTFTVLGMQVAGNVTYAATGAAVSDVLLALSGAASQQTDSTPTGSFLLTAPAVGNYTLTAVKQGELRTALSAYDAALIAQCVVGLQPLSVCPAHSADVDGDGRIMALDAALIARHVVGLHDPNSQVGAWRFAPSARNFSPLAGDAAGQNFQAYLVGDVDGNWPGAAAASSAPVGGSIAVAFGSAAGTRLPITLQGVDNHALIAVELTATYDPARFDFLSVDQTGTLSAGWNVVYNAAEPGRVRIAAYHVVPLSGDGEFLALHLRARDGGLPAATLQDARFDAGAPTAHILTDTQRRVALPIIAR